jgi:O-antigen/teichoic acid export membrane protein
LTASSGGLLVPVPLDYAPDASGEVQPPPGTLSRSSIWGRAASAIGLDRAIAFTVLARVWSALSAALTVTLVLRTLTREQQGYWGVINPLVGVQIIFELGFSFVILQTASHESAHLHIHPDGTITGPAREHGRLASILQRALRWYTGAAVLLLIFLLLAGSHYFAAVARQHPSAAPVHWLGPWVLAAIAASFTFQIDPIFSFLEGCGFVAQVARARLSQFICGSILSLAALLLHHGLYAPGCMLAGQAFAGFWAIRRHRQLLLNILRHDPGPHRTPFRTDIWPLQWRMAVSWVCGYAAIPLFVPVLMGARAWGPIEAGRMAVSISVASKVADVALAWMNTKSAPFGRLIALGHYGELDRRFFRSLAQSSAIGSLGALAVLVLAIALAHTNSHYATRFLSPAALACLLFGYIANTIVSSMAIYLRAHKQEKFMVNSILGALYSAPMAWVLGHRFGGIGIAAGYAVGSLVIGLGYGTYTFLHWRRIWHGTRHEAVA